MTSQILDLVYTEKVREDEGGTYGVYVGGTLQKYQRKSNPANHLRYGSRKEREADEDHFRRNR